MYYTLLFDSALILQKLGLVTVVFLVTLGIAAYSTYGERKVAAFLQDRLGPDRAGPFGLLQPIADGVKMFMKEVHDGSRTPSTMPTNDQRPFA